jgi:hypothetical protein
MSFGNIVNSLRSVRNEYNEHLKSVPQYEAFLSVESSTRKVADTLESLVNSGTASMAAEVIEALETAKAKFRQHLTSVPEYRALLAIDKLISDVSADLGIEAEVQVAAQVSAEQAPVDTNATTESGTVAQVSTDGASAAQASAVEPIQDTREQVAVVEQSAVSADAIAHADATIELTSAQAISQIQTALQSPASSEVSEIAQQAVPSAEPSTAQPAYGPPVAEAFERDSEKAA